MRAAFLTRRQPRPASLDATRARLSLVRARGGALLPSPCTERSVPSPIPLRTSFHALTPARLRNRVLGQGDRSNSTYRLVRVNKSRRKRRKRKAWRRKEECRRTVWTSYFTPRGEVTFPLYLRNWFPVRGKV